MPAPRSTGDARKGDTPCRNCWKNWRRSGSTFDIPGKTRRLNELDRELSDPELWNNAARARQVTQEAGNLRRIVEDYTSLQSDATGLAEMLDLASDEEREMFGLQRELIAAFHASERRRRA